MTTRSGRVAYVAGGSGGIGRAVCESLTVDGYTVVSLSRSGRGPSECTSVAVDLEDEADLARAFVDARETVGPPTVVVHSIGDIYEPASIAEADWGRWLKTYSVCVGTAVRLARLVFDDLVTHSGTFVTISSVASHHHYDGITDYCAAKAALEAFVRGLAIELAPAARAVAIAPAVVDTDLFGRSPYSVEEAASWHRLGRIGTPSDVAELTRFVVSERAAWMTGSCITLDGGMTL